MRETPRGEELLDVALPSKRRGVPRVAIRRPMVFGGFVRHPEHHARAESPCLVDRADVEAGEHGRGGELTGQPTALRERGREEEAETLLAEEAVRQRHRRRTTRLPR
jgi:hypothetical protein